MKLRTIIIVGAASFPAFADFPRGTVNQTHSALHTGSQDDFDGDGIINILDDDADGDGFADKSCDLDGWTIVQGSKPVNAFWSWSYKNIVGTDQLQVHNCDGASVASHDYLPKIHAGIYGPGHKHTYGSGNPITCYDLCGTAANCDTKDRTPSDIATAEFGTPFNWNPRYDWNQDGLFDYTFGQYLDAPSSTDLDNDGLNLFEDGDSPFYDPLVTLADLDQDGIPNWLDEDADGDGLCGEDDSNDFHATNGWCISGNDPPDDDVVCESDRDGDGIPDDQDLCPDDPEDYDGIQDNDGCPEDDADNDGVLDGDDLCPFTPVTILNDANGDGCPDDGGNDNDPDDKINPTDGDPTDPITPPPPTDPTDPPIDPPDPTLDECCIAICNRLNDIIVNTSRTEQRLEQIDISFRGFREDFATVAGRLMFDPDSWRNIQLEYLYRSQQDLEAIRILLAESNNPDPSGVSGPTDTGSLELMTGSEHVGHAESLLDPEDQFSLVTIPNEPQPGTIPPVWDLSFTAPGFGVIADQQFELGVDWTFWSPFRTLVHSVAIVGATLFGMQLVWEEVRRYG